ncbi:general secretory system II protein E domain-containing protein [Xanthomonas translucens pv. poae]|uniref:General secretory system II protein E domain-containing protein n=1 Tax=Xanthomonas graminis pv. poae TaxID=227946 RepID=A0A0K2ZIB6_9XANT|nr:glycosyl transferase family protein [Xanthomonas translucens]UKE61382.1 glycosyl transferase family protein [Xanthomonas translucens pv. poae]CTP83105.1 general secretory system II protein E domain-containing protein [Xanthomonas translucens pv. poae]
MDSLYWNIQLANYYAFLETAAVVVAVVILISSLDDLFIDAWYWVRELWRSAILKQRSEYRPLTQQDLLQRPQQTLAIMVPAWAEFDVIGQMVENMIDVLDYHDYMVFVGTYPNDAQTIAEVERMRRRYKRMRRIEVPHDGPTSKADCLNWLVLAIFEYEKQNDITFAGVVLHDSEDVLHPMELRFFNYLLPRKDMIQLPVTSLDREWYELVAGVYMDEFAEWHAKDLVVRESVSGMVPSAGVGTCFSRKALLALSQANDNQPFNPDSLTEDYDVGARLAAMGMDSIFARFPVQFRVRRPSWFGWGPVRERTLHMALCVREYFPDNFRASYRQKARWVLGIGLQSWETLGWRGSLATKYLLARDRKGIVTSFVSVFAYLIFLQLLLFWLLKIAGTWATQFPTIFQRGTWQMNVALLTTAALATRVAQRFYFVNRLYGWEHALMSIPRMVVGNMINFMATARAWRLFLLYLLLGKRMVWDKTMHDFPSAAQLVHTRRRLGELLTTWEAVEPERLVQALRQQEGGRQQPLGRILVAQGWLDDETLAEAIAFQGDLPRAAIDVAYLQAGRFPLSVQACVQWRLLPLPSDTPGEVAVAVSNALSADEQARLLHDLDASVLRQAIARESEINAGLRLISGESYRVDAVPLLGDLLVELRLIARDQFERVLHGYRPQRDGRIGDHLVKQGVATQAAIAAAVREQHRRASQPYGGIGGALPT